MIVDVVWGGCGVAARPIPQYAVSREIPRRGSGAADVARVIRYIGNSSGNVNTLGYEYIGHAQGVPFPL